jgi:hypothetical protein
MKLEGIRLSVAFAFFQLLIKSPPSSSSFFYVIVLRAAVVKAGENRQDTLSPYIP